MALNQVLIASSTLTSTASTISFTSIPQTYNDLVLRFSTRGNATDSADSWDSAIKFNTSSANQTFISLRGDGSGVNYNSLTDRMLRVSVPSNWGSVIFSCGELRVVRYTESVSKAFSVDATISNNTSNQAAQIMIAGQWAQNAAVTQIDLVASGTGNSFVSGSSVYLYGIKNS
jgi:hypothetical protein